MARNNSDIAVAGDAFSFKLTLTPDSGKAQSLIIEHGQSAYLTPSFNTEPGKFVFNYSAGVAGPSTAKLTANPNVTMHPTNGSTITGSIPQIRSIGTPDPIIRNTTPASNYPAIAAGTSIANGGSVQNFGVLAADTLYQIEFENAGSVTVSFTANMRGNPTNANTGETFNEGLSFGVRSNPAKIRFLKQSVGGTGTFSFSGQTNLSGLPAAINTALANPGPAAPTELTASSFNTSVTLTEAATAGFVLTGFSCSDSNGAVSGNSGTFGSFAGSVVTIPAANIKAGANITCTLVNSSANPALTVTKNSTLSSVSAAGTVIPYTILVQNSGNVTLTGITVTDTLAPVTCPTSGNNTIASLAASASETCTAQYTATQANFDSTATAISNTATAQTNYSGSPVSANSTRNVTIARNPLLTINKQADTAGPLTVGQVVNYTFLVKNEGNVTLSNINVQETAFNGTGTPPATPSTTGPTTLAPGQSVTFTTSYTVTQSDIDQLQ